MRSDQLPPGGLPLPAGLTDLPGGPELAALLAGVDRSRLSGYDVVVVLQARARQVAHEQAELMADMIEVAGRVESETATLPSISTSDIPALAAAEIGAALNLTKRSARSQLEDAWLVKERLPEVWNALRSGSIDLPKAKTFALVTRSLSEPLARQVSNRLLPDAADLTTGQLAHRLRKLVLEADPNSAERDYKRGVEERRLLHGTNPDGTGYLSATGLPLEQSSAAFERVDSLAKAAKQTGDDRPMDQIRTDIYLGLLSGTYDGPAPVHRRGVVELTCDLPTLLGLADNTGHIDGWGPVLADVARRTAAQLAEDKTTEIRFSITEPVTGRLLHHGTTRTRPRDPRRFLTPTDRAFVIARDRTCRGPGCRAPARRAEIDHVINHANGGPSQPWNTDAKCSHCHHLKDRGWQTKRNDQLGTTTWISPLGHSYVKLPEPITPPRELTPLERRLLAIAHHQT